MTSDDDRPINDAEFQAMWRRFERRTEDIGWPRPRRCSDIVAELRSRISQLDLGVTTSNDPTGSW
jgi:hypothetical protein